MKKIMSITGYGFLFCEVMYKEDARKSNRNPNPYRIYKVWWAADDNGRYKKHRKLVESYGDFASVLCYLRDDALGIAEKNYGSTVRIKGEGRE